MEFKELLQKYKDGIASEEECAAVEAELDRARLIEEYLAEEFAPADDFAPVDTGEFDRVKKSIKRRTRRIIMAAVSVAVVLAILAVSVLQPAIVNARIAIKTNIIILFIFIIFFSLPNIRYHSILNFFFIFPVSCKARFQHFLFIAYALDHQERINKEHNKSDP